MELFPNNDRGWLLLKRLTSMTRAHSTAPVLLSDVRQPCSDTHVELCKTLKDIGIPNGLHCRIAVLIPDIESDPAKPEFPMRSRKRRETLSSAVPSGAWCQVPDTPSPGRWLRGKWQTLGWDRRLPPWGSLLMGRPTILRCKTNYSVVSSMAARLNGCDPHGRSSIAALEGAGTSMLKVISPTGIPGPSPQRVHSKGLL